MTAADRGRLAAELVPIAADLVFKVHHENRETIGETLDSLTPAQARALPVVLAAMVDPEAHLNDLLGWVTWDEHGQPLYAHDRHPDRPAVATLRPCGTHAAYQRHKAASETPCRSCVEGERAYQRAKTRRQRRKADAA